MNNKASPSLSNLITFSTISLLLLSTNTVFSQEPFVISKMAQEPQMDGNLFEPAWDGLETHSLIMINPNSGIPATERSEFKIGYSDQYLYFAAFNYDSDPSLIQSSSKKRDELQLNNDWCGIMLDTYNDHENALDFSTTPAALRLDFQIINDGVGDFPANVDWNAIWDVETQLTEEGWFAEFRIPLSSLRYQVIDDKVTMGVAAFRYIARKSEWDIFPAIDNKWGFWSWAKVSQFKHAELHDIKAVNPLYFSPYILGGYQQSTALNETESEYDTKKVWQRSVGMDVKYGLAKNFTLDLTVNTDFAQVEADNQEINLTRYSLFFPEKRQFFMERANVFDFNFGAEGQLFYSRTIGLDNGQQIPLWGGGRITGRAGDWDIGVMSMQTGYLDNDTARLIESVNHSVIRSRRQIPLNKNSYIGFMGTSKIDVNGAYNLGYGIDAILNLEGNTYLKIALAQTAESDMTNNMASLDPTRYQLFLEKRTFEGLSYNLNYERSGETYNPGMGFEFRKDFTKFGHSLAYGFIPGEESKTARSQASLAGTYYLRNMDQSLETVDLKLNYIRTSKQSTELSFSIPVLIDDVRGSFDLSDRISIAPGQYKNIGLEGSFSTSSERMVSSRFGAFSGSYYGGWQNSASVSPMVSLGNTWRFSMDYYFYRINFSEQNEIYQTQLLRFRMWYMYSTKLSAIGYVQYNSLTQGIFINAKLRLNPKEGNDLYIVYNDAINTSRFDYSPELPFSNQRTILIKYTHTFRVR